MRDESVDEKQRRCGALEAPPTKVSEEYPTINVYEEWWATNDKWSLLPVAMERGDEARLRSHCFGERSMGGGPIEEKTMILLLSLNKRIDSFISHNIVCGGAAWLMLRSEFSKRNQEPSHILTIGKELIVYKYKWYLYCSRSHLSVQIADDLM